MAKAFEFQYRKNAPRRRVSLSNRLKLLRDLCKTPPFAQFLRQTQILILEILDVCLWLKFLSSLALNKIEHFSKVSVLKHP